MPRLSPFPALTFALLALPGCDALFGGDFGHDPDAAMARMHKMPALFAPGEIEVESVWEPGEGITHIRFMYRTPGPTCAEPMMTKMCDETRSIRKTTGAKVEAWCHGTSPATEACVDGRRLASFTR
ncbi:MAG: hypothetical protein QM820_14930 [Minicystis sp.]